MNKAIEHSRVECRAYANQELCDGDIMGLLIIQEGEKQWAKRRHYVRHFTNTHETLGRSVAITWTISQGDRI